MLKNDGAEYYKSKSYTVYAESSNAIYTVFCTICIKVRGEGL